MIRLGGPIPQNDDESASPQELVQEHQKRGYTAAYCPSVRLDDKPRIRALREAYAEADITIAEVGAWGNLQPADPKKRSQVFEYACERLALADEIGALCCVNYIGSLQPGTEFAPHPDNLSQEGFDRCVEICQSIIDAVHPRQAKWSLETMQTLLPDSPEAYLDLCEAIDRPGFGVHLDPANLVVSPRIYHNTPELLERCFRLLGDQVLSCHAKDLVMHEALALHMDEVVPGDGVMDYKTLLRLLDDLDHDAPLMLEHLSSEKDYRRAASYVRATAEGIGVEVR